MSDLKKAFAVVEKEVEELPEWLREIYARNDKLEQVLRGKVKYSCPNQSSSAKEVEP